MRRILIAGFAFILSFSILPISQAAAPTWFTPTWDKTVTSHTEIQVRNTLTGTTMLWVGLPTAITTDKVGCANVTYVLGPTLGLNPAGSLTKYAEFEVSISIESGEILAGELPRKQLRLVQAWMELHYDELMADWELAVGGELPYKIAPL